MTNEAIKSGVPGATVKDEMKALEAKRLEYLAALEAASPPMPRLHPNLAELYREKVMNLAEGPECRSDPLGGHRMPPGVDRGDPPCTAQGQAQNPALR